MTDFLDTSLNTSKKNMFCNHCMFDCVSYEIMKDHYKSEFHKYNLNRVTMNLNPLTHSDYLKKKEMYQKLQESKNPNNGNKLISTVNTSISSEGYKCDICKKLYSSLIKLNEHNLSKAHKKAEETYKETPKDNTIIKEKKTEDEKSTLDDITICLFCNSKNENLESNIKHMHETHQFDIPLPHCIKNWKGLIKLLAKKIFTYMACLTCDNQNFKNYKGLQNHMIDKIHTSINTDDLEEFLYKFYDKNKILSIKEREVRIMKEFKILKIKLNIANRNKIKEKIKDDSEGWETVSEDENEETQNKNNKLIKDEESDEEFEPVALPNGELLLENGTIVGNKIYQLYYKQRVHLNKYEKLAHSIRLERLNRLPKIKKLKRRISPNKIHDKMLGSNKSAFQRINTLFKARKQVNV